MLFLLLCLQLDVSLYLLPVIYSVHFYCFIHIINICAGQGNDDGDDDDDDDDDDI